VMQRLGDRVHRWATINEPRCAAFVGHLEGRHAPGLRSLSATLCAAHHLLLAHGLGVQAMRAAAPQARLGIVLDVKAYTPASPSDDDRAAVVRADGVFNRWFLDPLFKGRYPSDVAAGFAQDMPLIGAGDLRTISQPIDSLGLNYYTRGQVRHDGSRVFPHAGELRVNGAHYSAMGWEDYPDGLHTMLMRIAREYMPPEMYIAENGCAEHDVLSADGRVHDPHRERYLRGHLAAASQAVVGGVPLAAYFAWSLMDNFEWGHGYGKRFGLLYVDYPTQRRIAKDSMLAYREVIAQARAGAART
jgi:beta-glucosidase